MKKATLNFDLICSVSLRRIAFILWDTRGFSRAMSVFIVNVGQVPRRIGLFLLLALRRFKVNWTTFAHSSSLPRLLSWTRAGN